MEKECEYPLIIYNESADGTGGRAAGCNNDTNHCRLLKIKIKNNYKIQRLCPALVDVACNSPFQRQGYPRQHACTLSKQTRQRRAGKQSISTPYRGKKNSGKITISSHRKYRLTRLHINPWSSEKKNRLLTEIRLAVWICCKSPIAGDRRRPATHRIKPTARHLKKGTSRILQNRWQLDVNQWYQASQHAGGSGEQIT